MRILDKFEKICAIEHCSFDALKLRDYLVEFAKSYGYSVEIDEFDNVYAFKGKPQICLQSHYDMVCVGQAPKIELIYDGDILRAKNSSLGADNGIGVAIMMEMMSKFNNLEVIFSANEEVGLIGANGFNKKIISNQLLNLDSEDEDGVFIGCAAGELIKAKISKTKKSVKSNLYELNISGLPGGHSGIEIIKDLPNSIKIMAEFIAKNGGKIVNFSGGERNNSIPVNAKALITCDNIVYSDERVSVKYLGNCDCEVISESQNILDFINSFSQGVRSYNESLNIVNDSINLSIINDNEDSIEIEFFARSMSQHGLERLKFETSTLARLAGFGVSFFERSDAWTPDIGEFANLVLNFMQKYNPKVKFQAVHAGLECGVFVAKQKGLQAASIGPNIHSPHSINEHLELKSLDKIAKAISDIVAYYQD
ncbi:aminoacyl-histidine dipeptidase [Campylobacter lanienae NCTC 13004]|uniref:Aminoacyl-histidine dipeptidase n=1 Tax=Campylobacter lanienae NCTC 13004 TaxID=1031753 RepID=A0A1X9SMQ8_9BACT|nr:M20/M25/M40 family metallo-hydrolase [Campylobacter lanienae]ARQ97505.1 aminoacyl-histidine dipeptidase [Campylobacter lanienae NCTC 13004]